MTTYYSNKEDFENDGSLSSGTTGTGYYNASTVTNPSTKVTTMLEDISTVTSTVKSEGVSNLYKQTGDAALGTEKKSSTFTTSVERTQTMLSVAKRIHSEIMQNIDSKFVKGLDEAYNSLNNVNSGDKSYKSKSMTYETTKIYQMYGTGGYGSMPQSYTVQEHYTLSELLGSDSPIKAAQDVYKQRLDAIKAKIKSGDGLTDKQRQELKGKSDKELMNEFYPTTSTDYQRIKGSSFQEDHKEALKWVEFGLTITASVVAIIATAGAATPAVAAAATAANAYLIGSTAYSAVTGKTLITGDQLNTEERVWAAADLVATAVSAGSSKVLGLAEAGSMSTKAAAVVEHTRPLLNAGSHADDVMDALHIGKDVVTGDTQSLAMDVGLKGLSMGVKAHNRGVDAEGTRVRTSDVSTSEHAPEQSSSKARVEDLDVPKATHVTESGAAAKGEASVSSSTPVSGKSKVDNLDVPKAKHVTESGETAAGQVASTKAQAEPLAETVAAGVSGKASQVRSVDVNKAETGSVKSEVAGDLGKAGEVVGNANVADDVPRIEKIDVEFNHNPKYDEAEFAKQLSNQEKGMNELTVQEYLDNRERYLAEGRSIEGNAAQKVAREDAFETKYKELRDSGLSRSEAQTQAQEWLDTQAALHNPDQIAGGNPLNIGGVGDKAINSSIGSQWRYRIDAVDEQIQAMAAKMTPEQLQNTYLNVKLTY